MSVNKRVSDNLEVIIGDERPDGSRRIRMHFKGPGRTRKEFKQDADINYILQRFKNTGQLPSRILENPRFGDFSEVPVYQDALNTVLHAQEQFSLLSAKIRARFANDPVEFLRFVNDPKNAKEMVELGLAKLVSPTPSPAPQEPRASSNKKSERVSAPKDVEES